MDKVKFLMIEAGSELEMGIPPNIAIIVSTLKKADIDIKIFSTNLYVSGAKTGDQVRVETLQVPPTSSDYLKPYKKNIKTIYDDLFEMVQEYKPDIVGISITEPMFELGCSLLDHVRKHVNFIIVGGAYAVLCPEEIITQESVDAVCVSEGEDAVVKLCRSIKNDNIDYGIHNLWFKKDGVVIKNEVDPVYCIDDVVFQDWSEWDIPPRASKPMAGDVNVTALVELSRGCPFKCSYCANSFLNATFRGNYREKDISRFIEEVKYLRDMHNVSFIYIADETILTTTNKRFSEFVNAYREVSLPFWCETRPEHVSYRKIKLLKDIGLKTINVGIEGGNRKFRKEVLNRSYSDEDVVRAIHGAKKTGVGIGANVIIGFPSETRDHVFETIEIIRESQPSSTMIHLFQPYRKTPLRDKCVEMGLIDENYICGDYRMNAIGTGYLNAKDLLGLQRTFNLYVTTPKSGWGEICRAEKFDREGNKIFKKLAKKYQKKMFGKTSF